MTSLVSLTEGADNSEQGTAHDTVYVRRSDKSDLGEFQVLADCFDCCRAIFRGIVDACMTRCMASSWRWLIVRAVD